MSVASKVWHGNSGSGWQREDERVPKQRAQLAWLVRATCACAALHTRYWPHFVRFPPRYVMKNNNNKSQVRVSD